MDLQTLKRRLARLDPLLADALIAIGLTALVWLQIWAVTHIPSPVPGFGPGPGIVRIRLRPDFGVLPYLFAASVFLPLALRRSAPWIALGLSGIAAATYQLQPFPPAFTVVGPMIALYSLAAYTKRRHVALIALLIVGLIVAVPAFAFSFGVRWVAQAVGTFTLLAAATLLGDTARNRREYIAEVEKRAAEAERSREEEALRRVDEERMRIAREVHDIVAHSLSIVTVQAAAAEAVLDTDPAQARESLANIRATGREALGELRSMLDVLRTGDGGLPLTPAADLSHLEQLVAPLGESSLNVELSTEGDMEALPAYASVSAYRIVQEALTNVVRHADADAVRVRIHADESELVLRVEDNGRGAPLERLEGGGHGIQGMRERVEALGGRFEADSPAEGGVSISATIPLTRSA